MMFLQSQGELALGSRFKMLSEALYAIANEVYRATGVELDAHAFPLLRYVQVKGPATVTQIAQAIGQTHSAVSQMAAKLQRTGWLTRKTDRADARRGVLDLSVDGERRLAGLGPIWCAIRRGAGAAVARSTGPLLDGLSGLERELGDGRLLREILAQHKRLTTARVEIKPFRPIWREHFLRLNAQWLERYFAIEPIDHEILEQPERCVLKPGGAIFFALLGGEVIGTGALLKESPGVYELSKMAVEPGFRGMGAGRALLDAAIAEFHKRRGKTLFLESNSRLTPALTLYENAGFVHQSTTRANSHYQRADVYMIYAAKAERDAQSMSPTRAGARVAKKRG